MKTTIETSRNCLKLFLKHVYEEGIEDIPSGNEIQEMSLKDMLGCTKTVYMKYILSKKYSTPSNSITTFAYNHLIEVINNTEEEDSIEIKEICTDERGDCQEKHPKSEGTGEITKKKGWFN